MSFSQLDTFLFESQLWKARHHGFTRCLVITTCLFAKRSREFSHHQRQSRLPTLKKNFLGLNNREMDLLGQKQTHSGETVAGKSAGPGLLLLIFYLHAENKKLAHSSRHLISVQWEMVITTNFIRTRHFTAILTVDQHERR